MACIRTGKADIRSKTRRCFEFSLIAALLLITGAFRFFPALEREAIVINASDEIITVEVVDNTRQHTQPPPPPRPPIPIAIDSDDILPDVDIIFEFDQDDPMPPPRIPPEPQPEKEDEDDIFVPVEEAPEIIGGMSALMKNLVYPDLAIRAGIEGNVTVLAYVNKEGVVVRTELLRGIGGGCDEAAMEAVKQVRFRPAEQRGKPVNVKVSVPVRFRLR
jgi:periplasmic protein TonB